MRSCSGSSSPTGLEMTISAVVVPPTAQCMTGSSMGRVGSPVSVSSYQNSPACGLMKAMVPTVRPATRGEKSSSYLTSESGPGGRRTVSSPRSPSPWIITENSSSSGAGLEIGISTATTLRSGAEISSLRSHGGGSACISTVYHMYRPSGAVNVIEPRSSPPSCGLTVSTYSVAAVAASADLARGGTPIDDGPETCSRSDSTVSATGAPVPPTLKTAKETDVGMRAAQSMTTLPSASGSSPTPLSVYTYLSPVLRLVRVSSPSRSHTQSGLKSSG